MTETMKLPNFDKTTLEGTKERRGENAEDARIFEVYLWKMKAILCKGLKPSLILLIKCFTDGDAWWMQRHLVDLIAVFRIHNSINFDKISNNTG